MTTILDEKLEQLAQVGVSEEIRHHMRQHIEETDWPGLVFIPPYRLADQWQLPRPAVLDAFLQATRYGLFDLVWNVRCPGCQGLTEYVEHLAELAAEGHCAVCRYDFEPGFDNDIEVTFEVNPNIRQIDRDRRRHRAELMELEPILELRPEAGRAAERKIDLDSGTYYLHEVEQFQSALPLMVKDGPSPPRQQLGIIYDGQNLSGPDSHLFYTGSFAFRVENKTDRPLELRLSRRQNYPWVSAAEIASNQNFRDLFSTELIAPDETFAIRNVVFVFTDIKGSTALYERLGDSDAYYLVKEHFKILGRQVQKHNGAIVKTIGDAVMATFMVSGDAIRALFGMQQAFAAFNADIRDQIIIKVGAHRGPCIAVTSNDRLDYFGRTVNIAARVQGLSTGNDIVLTKPFYEETEVHRIVQESGWAVEVYPATLKGIEELYEVVHLKN